MEWKKSTRLYIMNKPHTIFTCLVRNGTLVTLLGLVCWTLGWRKCIHRTSGRTANGNGGTFKEIGCRTIARACGFIIALATATDTAVGAAGTGKETRCAGIARHWDSGWTEGTITYFGWWFCGICCSTGRDQASIGIEAKKEIGRAHV